MTTFEIASGQKVNYAKSSIFFSPNNSDERRRDLCNLLGMMEADENNKYLGLPNCLGRNKSATLGYLKERVRQRLHSWDGRILSRAGKEILIKTVAQSLPNYAMSVFLLPIEMCRDLEQMMTKFWWRKSVNAEKGIHWMSWDRMSRHKSVGGLGFRNLRDFNLALLGKQGWRMITYPESLVSRIFRARYYPDSTFLDASLGYNPSFVWRSIWEARHVLLAGARWRIGDGTIVDVLRSPWLPHDEEPFVASYHPGLEGAKVSSLMIEGTKEWDLDLLQDMFEPRDRELICSIPLSLGEERDCMYWSKEISGKYSVKSAYKLLQFLKGRWGGEMDTTIWRRIWKLKVPPKVKDLLWRACTLCLPTADQLRKKFVPIQERCVMCEVGEETILHVLVHCNFAKQCINNISEGAGNVHASSFSEWLRVVSDQVGKDKTETIAVVCWSIWRARNEKVWKNKAVCASEVVSTSMGLLDQWKKAQSNDSCANLPMTVVGDGARSWVKPQCSQIKVNVDAALFEETNSFGFGLVARDCRGELMEAQTMQRVGRVGVELAEALGIREALSWIKKKGWEKVVLESDCQTCISAIRNPFTMDSPFGLIIRDCRNFLRTMDEVSLLFVYRSANGVAHSFARASRSFPERTFSGRDVPIELLTRILDESH